MKTNERYFISTVKSLERDKESLERQLDQVLNDKHDLALEVEKMAALNRTQELKIDQLMRELQALRAQGHRVCKSSLSYDSTRSESQQTSSPPSIIRCSSGSPKRKNVAFNSALKVAKYNKNDFKIVMMKSSPLKDNSQRDYNFLDRVVKSRDKSK
jgi:hypothetical protein